MADRMTFTLVGRDHLSRVLRRAGRAARDMDADITAASANSDEAVTQFTRDANGRLRDARGRFAAAGDAAQDMGRDVAAGSDRGSSGLQRLSDAMRGTERSGGHLKAKLVAVGVTAALPGAIVGAAALAELAAAAGTVAVAVGAVGVAIIPQIKSITGVAKAATKYSEALKATGGNSQEALKAAQDLRNATHYLAPATQEAAAAFLVLRTSYSKWSDSLSPHTMPMLTHGFQTLSGLLPHLSPLISSAGDELDRFVKILAGGMESTHFDHMMKKFNDFATKTLQHMNAGLVHFIGLGQTFDGSAISAFMAKAAEYGPVVSQTLHSVGAALLKIMEAGGEVGVILLHVVDNMARIVNAVPTEALTTLLQFYTAFKLIGLGAAGLAAAAGLVGKFTTAIVGMTASSAAATGALASIRAGFAALSTTAKLNIVIAGIAALVVVMTKLSDIGNRPAANVSKLTTSLKELGRTGQITGEAAKAFGKDLDGLADSLRVLARPSISQSIDKWAGSLVGIDTRKVSDAKEDFESIDSALAEMVKSGNADLAAAALRQLADRTAEASKKNGHAALTTKEFKAQLDGYKQALKDAQLAQTLAADSMGLFGRQAQKTQEKLNAQKQSADGLRQSLQALNDVQRKGLGGMVGFEQAIDDATKAAKENAGALHMVDGKLDLNGQKARDATKALQDLAAKTDEAASSARESGQSWATVNGIYERGRKQLVKVAMQMGLTKTEAKKLAGQILKVPDKEVIFKGNLKDLKAKVNEATKRVHDAPASKLTRLKGNISDLEDKLAAAKRNIKSVPKSKRSHILGEISDLERKLAEARRELGSVHDKTVTITYRSIYTGKIGRMHAAQGGYVGGYASGGAVQGFPGGGSVSGPGTSTSDSVPAMLSDGEYVIRAAMVKRYGLSFMNLLNSGRLLDFTVTQQRGGRLFQMGGEDIGRRIIAGLAGTLPDVRDAARKLAGAVPTSLKSTMPTSGYGQAVGELSRLVSSGDWRREGSKLFEDISFQSMSSNFKKYQDKIADGFWAAVQDIKKAVASGKPVFEDMTYKGMSADVSRFHDAIAQIWKGNPYGANFGDWGNFGKYRSYGVRNVPVARPMAMRAAAPAASTPASQTTVNVYPQRADFSVHDLEALQRRMDVRARVGRPR